MLLVLIPLSSVDAQPGPSFVAPCLDTMVVNSQYVMVGRIIEIHPLVSNGPNTNVIVEIEKWLKGAGSGDRLGLRIDMPAVALTEWKTHASRLLILGNSAIDLSDMDVKVLTAEMKVLRDPARIIQAAQDAIARHPGVYRMETFTRRVPPVTAKLLTTETWVTSIVPADADLERWALKALDSSQALDRAEGAQALWFFNSDSNVSRLRKLLDDPGLVDNGGGIQIYVVRMRAYESLRRMGVKVLEPVTRQ
jgi:hypothetical protein